MIFTEYLNILHHLHAMKITSLKLFLICMVKNPNLADIFTNFVEKEQKKEEEEKNNSAEFMEFFKSGTGHHGYFVIF